MHDIRWDDVKDWFDPLQNGSAPDVVVCDTTIEDWENLFRLIRSEGWRCEYEHRDQRQPLPTSAAELFFPNPEGWVQTLWVWPDPDLEWIIRPWSQSPEVMVSDVSLYEIQGQERFDAFCRFLRTLGTALGKPARYYPEGSYHSYPPILAYEVADDRTVFLAGPWQ